MSTLASPPTEPLPAFLAEWIEEESKRESRFKTVRLPISSISSSLDEKIRRGIPHTLRLPIWFSAITNTSLANHDPDTDFIGSAFTRSLPELLDLFGLKDTNIFMPSDPALLQLLLNAFVDAHPSMTVAPLVPLASSMLLQRTDPPLALFLLEAMFSKGSFYFTPDELAFLAWLRVIETWVCGKCRKLMSWIDRMSFGLTDVLVFFLPACLTTVVDRHTALTFFDIFLIDGRALLSRLCAAALLSLEGRIVVCVSWDAFRQVVFDFLGSLSAPANLSAFLTASLKTSLARRAMGPAEEKALQAILAYQQSGSMTLPRIGGDGPPCPGSAQTLPVSSERSRPLIRRFTESVVTDGRLLHPHLLLEIRRALPPSMDRYGTAALRYRMSVDGTAMSTLIGRSVKHGLWIIAFQTERRSVGAAFEGSLSIALAKKGKFIDQGAVVVFAVESEATRVYKRVINGNRMLYAVEPTAVTVGGPKPALYLTGDFRNIHSAPCETFDSPALADNGHVGDRIIDAELFELVGDIRP